MRVKDLELDRQALIVRDGKGAQDRVTVLPDSLIPLLKEHLGFKQIRYHDVPLNVSD